MSRRPAFAVIIALLLSLTTGPAAAAPPQFTPGASGLGDPYFPADGNGGYDVEHYLLEVQYDPETDTINGVATITALATQDLSQFNLDFDDALDATSVVVNRMPAASLHSGDELVITPASGIRKNTRFVVVIAYGGVPETIEDFLGTSGFIHTEDGALVIGQPHVAATWFPANDHPSDRAAFTFRVTVPAGLEVVANGRLAGQSTAGDWTTWEWEAADPMATYLAGMAIGELAVQSYRSGRIQYWDAVDPALLAPVATPSGAQFAVSQQANNSYKRLMHQITVPAEGATVSFTVTRSTEEPWDFFFVEAHAVGTDEWTTLPDLEGNAQPDTGFSCPFWLAIHPFLEHYQTPPEGEPEEFVPCEPVGTTGAWWAATGESDGAETWTIDLSAYANSTIEVALTYASDDVVQLGGVFVDDIVVSTGEGTTGFEEDGDTLDGWTVPGAPEGSPGNENDWIIGTAADVPPSSGEIALGSFARQPEIISVLEQSFGAYPFRLSGGIVDVAPIFFALENQTRPIYAEVFFSDSFSGDNVIVHELAHQWFGDSLTVSQWQHIWLNEGFATYAEWLWSEYEGLGTAQENFDFFYNLVPADDPFWDVTIGDPGPELMFDLPVYWRGGMTLHQLRLAVGDAAFFQILREWARTQAGDTVSTDEFIALAEAISGQDLDELFETWLFTSGRPDVGGASASALRAAPSASTRLTEWLRLERAPRS